MNDRAVKVDQIDSRCRALIGREHSKAGPRALAIQGPEACASASKLHLFDWHGSVATGVSVPAGSAHQRRGIMQSDHSGLMPANLATLPHFSVSWAISRPKSAGDPV